MCLQYTFWFSPEAKILMNLVLISIKCVLRISFYNESWCIRASAWWKRFVLCIVDIKIVMFTYNVHKHSAINLCIESCPCKLASCVPVEDIFWRQTHRTNYILSFVMLETFVRKVTFRSQRFDHQITIAIDILWARWMVTGVDWGLLSEVILNAYYRRVVHLIHEVVLLLARIIVRLPLHPDRAHGHHPMDSMIFK